LFPETNIFAGFRQIAGYACALNGSAVALPRGEQRMSVATSFALLAFQQMTGGGNGLLALLPMVLMVGVLYLLMIRPQQKRQKQWQSMLAGIKAGDRVTTAGGIRGIILSIKDDTIIVRVAPDNLKLEVAKSAIASVIPQDSPSGS
jgi:preprotein translocase subunit YajC